MIRGGPIVVEQVVNRNNCVATNAGGKTARDFEQVVNLNNGCW